MGSTEKLEQLSVYIREQIKKRRRSSVGVSTLGSTEKLEQLSIYPYRRLA